MSKPPLSKSERIALWLDRLNRFSQSSHSLASFCEAEGISAASFYQWKRRLRPSVEVAKSAAQADAVELSAANRSGFVEVEISPGTDAIRVLLPGNVTLELGGRLDAVATVVREVLLISQQLASASPNPKA